MEYLADEFHKKAKLSFLNWTISKEDINEKDLIYQYLNVALSLQSMNEYSSLSVLQSTTQCLFQKNSHAVEVPHLDYKVS